ncbi:MAG: NfeD family protein [Lachnospiraceae bacterium]|nr:NfeD family protein [Lachnospiraceae bacterium]
MNDMLIFWLILLIVTIAIEALTLGLTSIWFAGGALVAILAALLNLPVIVQIVLFVVVSVVMLIFTRPIAVKYFNKDRIRTNVESMVGKQAIVISEIDNLQGIGQVTVGGQEWSARSADDKLSFQVGEVVRVVAVNGVKLVVKPDVNQ